MQKDVIYIQGARENNLKNITLTIPRNKLVIMTGLSGSGKTSLAFDTIYAEGQRRYVESLSAYARQFLGNTEKPDVDVIEGLSPSISIDQKTTSHNPRSTVGTVTEIYDYLRLLYARVGTPYCPTHHEPIVAQTVRQMVDRVMKEPDGERLQILAPIVRAEKGTHKEVLDKLRKEGYIRVRVNGENKLLEDEINLEKNKKHTIDVIVDRIVKQADSTSRLYDSLENALKLAKGLAIVISSGEELLFSSNYSCPKCGFSIPELQPRLFSFNSPLGACEHCKGLGMIQMVDVDYLIPDRTKSVTRGGIVYFKNILKTKNIEWQVFETLAEHYDIDLTKPINQLTDKELKILLIGSTERIKYSIKTRSGNSYSKNEHIEGIQTMIQRRHLETTSSMAREWYQSFMSESTCPECQGRRLNPMALCVEIGPKNINEWTKMSVKQALIYMESISLKPMQTEIAHLVLKEIRERLNFLKDVGLEYLTLDRIAGSLSGGEAQRIRLATQIGSRLTGVLYVLDEPSIGLHQRDNMKLINTLKSMRDLGNTLIVVEHDEETMMESDYIIDIGPGAGKEGGEVVATGTPAELIANPTTITGKYLAKILTNPYPENRRVGNGKSIKIQGASGNNLKNISVDFPLGVFNCVTGVSGSGKSTLVNDILGKSLAHFLGRPKVKPGAVEKIEGMKEIDKLIEIDQDPIGRTPRSNPVTYTGVFDDIRDLFALSPEAKVRGYDKSRFSFNVKGGRCELCQGDGVKRISMHFLPDVYVPCEECEGKRYNNETLDVTYKGKNIYDILEMTVDEALLFFVNIHKIHHRLKTLQDVGLGYIKLGQSATTLSGGEAQRVKLASELQRRATGKTVFILDEPTTGLHSFDVGKLLPVLQRIVDNGDTVIVIEHNLDIIKNADNIIDLGPEGGDEGGYLIGTGTPESLSQNPNSVTGQYLRKVLR
ncbi:MAG: excinuclease ABC subunit A [Erysipelotrichaceae bacterium]|nr:MAG: excinuclease ABC subunit [Erysipelotrichaceae bacterium]TXT19493.1 MAG: excinuclease ABC subunit A [Erysipelotrichaceae bacterium]